MSNGRYNHNAWIPADDFPPRGPRRTSGYFEEPERKRNFAARSDNNDHGRREFGASGGNGGNGGNDDLMIRWRAVGDQ